MGFAPQSSRHTYGPGQNEIDFRISHALKAADNMIYYKTVVKNVAAQSGLFASFMPKPLENQTGSGLHIGISIKKDGEHIFSSDPETLTEEGKQFIAGILSRIKELTCFLDPTTNSYRRLQGKTSPTLIDWSFENRSQLIRIPSTMDSDPQIIIRSSDAACNPYIAFKLLLAAGFEGIEKKLDLDSLDLKSEKLPETLEQALSLAKNSELVKSVLSEKIRAKIFGHVEDTLTRYGLANSKSNFENDYYFASL